MSKNQALFDRAQQTIPGGVNSPVRAFRSVGGTPRFIERAQGPYFWDADGQRYIDYIGSWGPMILGHVHPEVLDAVQRVLANGFSFGAPTEAEIEIAEEICKLVPSIEQVRMVSSGTEATMSALRLARGFTNRSRIVKFEGCYHGHADSLLVKAGSGLADVRQSDVRRRSRRHREAHHGARIQQRRATERSVRGVRQRDRVGDRGADRGQHEPRARDARIPRRPCAIAAASTARC